MASFIGTALSARRSCRRKKAPDGVTAPDAEYNIIQWVPWDNAGFAYADDLMDPLSGQSEHGQAYITSVFAFMGRAGARVLLREHGGNGRAEEGRQEERAALRRACRFSVRPRLRDGPALNSPSKWRMASRKFSPATG